MKVKLTRDWKQYKMGEVLSEKDRPAYSLRFLLDQGWGVDVSVESAVPSADNTVHQIKQYLDAEGIEYSSDELKADLLNKAHGLSDSS